MRKNGMAGRKGRPLGMAVLATCLAALSLAPPAAGSSRLFGGTYRGFPTQSLWIRGYIDDACLAVRFQQCTAISSEKDRHEATAQKLAIWRLKELLGESHFTPSPNADKPMDKDKVQWEAGPKRAGLCATGSTYICANVGSWRVDITVDRRATTGEFQILEAKRWVSELTTRGEVDGQLNRYVTDAANQAQITFVRDTVLNTERWGAVWVDKDKRVWCVWADPNPGAHPGNVYFGLRDEALPEEARNQAPGDSCKRLEDRAKVPLALDDQDTLAATAEETLFNATPEQRAYRLPPNLDAFLAFADAACSPVRQRVTVPRDPTRPTTLSMNFGDGAATSATIPQGDGFTTLEFSHQFSCAGSPAYTQRATIVETGLYAVAVVGTPAAITASGGTPQSAYLGSNFTQPLAARKTDASGNPVPSAAVTFVAPASGPSGNFSGSRTISANTSAAGVATAPPFTADSASGSYTVTAHSSGVLLGTEARFALTNLSPPSGGGGDHANHFGFTHFCTGNSYCTYLFRYTGSLDNDSSYSQAIQDGRANSTYTLNYISGHDRGSSCDSSGTNFGTLSTNSSADGHTPISLAGVPTGNFTACPDLHGADEGTYHYNFTIVD